MISLLILTTIRNIISFTGPIGISADFETIDHENCYCYNGVAPVYLCKVLEKYRAVKSVRSNNMIHLDKQIKVIQMGIDLFLKMHLMSGINCFYIVLKTETYLFGLFFQRPIVPFICIHNIFIL